MSLIFGLKPASTTPPLLHPKTPCHWSKQHPWPCGTIGETTSWKSQSGPFRLGDGVSLCNGFYYLLPRYLKHPLKKWLFGETTISQVKVWKHPTETTIQKGLLRVPGKNGFLKANPLDHISIWIIRWFQHPIYLHFNDIPRRFKSRDWNEKIRCPGKLLEGSYWSLRMGEMMG